MDYFVVEMSHALNQSSSPENGIDERLFDLGVEMEESTRTKRIYDLFEATLLMSKNMVLDSTGSMVA